MVTPWMYPLAPLVLFGVAVALGFVRMRQARSLRAWEYALFGLNCACFGWCIGTTLVWLV